MEFQVGDKVVCVDNLGMENLLSLDEVSTVVSLQSNPRALHVSNGEGKIYAFSYRFKLVEDTKPAPNGVDAQGNGIYFDIEEDLKSWMRVVLANGDQSVVAEYMNGIKFVVDNRSWLSVAECFYDYAVTEVYEAPQFECDYLQSDVRGPLVWKRSEPKSKEQLAQEHAIEEAEKALAEAANNVKAAQEKLASLKKAS